jgi:hypothetical protein
MSDSWTLPRPVRVSRLEVDLWLGMAKDGLAASRTEDAPVSFGIFDALVGYLEDTLAETPAPPQTTADERWDADYAASHAVTPDVLADRLRAVFADHQSDSAPIQSGGSSWDPQ